MEDRRTRARKRLAGVREGIRDLSSPTQRQREQNSLIRPAVQCVIKGVEARYQPGDLLLCSYKLEVKDDVNLSAVETSVVWCTSGKGQEDIGVQFFERRQKDDLVELANDTAQKLTVRLPNTPLSYDGLIVKIGWCVRVRVFLEGGKQLSFDSEFALGKASRIVVEE